jgi:hypothetical protein
MKKFVLVLVILLGCLSIGFADTIRCDLCGKILYTTTPKTIYEDRNNGYINAIPASYMSDQMNAVYTPNWVEKTVIETTEVNKHQYFIFKEQFEVCDECAIEVEELIENLNLVKGVWYAEHIYAFAKRAEQVKITEKIEEQKKIEELKKQRIKELQDEIKNLKEDKITTPRGNNEKVK